MNRSDEKQYRKNITKLYLKFYNESNSNTEIRRKIKLQLRKEEFDSHFRFIASLQYKIEEINTDIESTKTRMKYDVDIHSKLFNKEYKSVYGTSLGEDYSKQINKLINIKRQIKIEALFLLSDYIISNEMSKRGINVEEYKKRLKLEEF